MSTIDLPSPGMRSGIDLGVWGEPTQKEHI